MKAADIILVKFPFTNLQTTKKRPCLILNTVNYSKSLRLYTIAMITSQVDGLSFKGDVHLLEWKECGLLHPSLIRLAKIATIEGELVEKKLGTLPIPVQKQIKKQFTILFENWI